MVGAIGMLAGFCGTLMTPMAANFNLVPAALLELKDQYGVIQAQIATALPLLVVNILLIYFAGLPMSARASTQTSAARLRRGSRSAMSRSEYPHKLDHVLGGDEDALPAARAAPDLLRQLRLAQLRPRLVDAADAAAAVSRTRPRRAAIEALADEQLHAGKGRRSSSPISTGR